MSAHAYSTILLLVDGTDEGMKAARHAIELAADEDATLVIAAVVDTSTLKQLLTYRIFLQEEMEDYEHELEATCQKHLNYVAQLAEKESVRSKTALLEGACHSELLKEQKRSGADLLVMGAFTASTARRDLIAREKQLIIDEVACPVLLVR